MENTKSKIINEIAQELDCGNECYYNPKTDEIIAIPNYSIIQDEEEFQELFHEDLEAIEKNRADLIEIDPLESSESFKIMELFVDQIADVQYKAKLEHILQERKPFQNFKNSIDNSDFRQEWFDFKKLEMEKIVEARLNHSK
ncbi:hypothetical protein Q73A0000_03985 [Kaistella flava (ex Peng et al. 2021)]|uniref:Uncharacterized protein n=1 Tax=Kaistella flava (ex Peng et al. 2021) TaxID=2038776 RepID=A0A7M2Y8C0_9FLAO|nr:UPF0158 family protein [Kaistella flava (ex Peng et al. 2021)]QOW09583.1 hypothetical protein Q73A0000_03985 [Kaistella flava (ex Peng et al. 2021)]